MKIWLYSGNGPLEGRGVYPASMAAELYGKHTPTFSDPKAMLWRHPFITQDGPDTGRGALEMIDIRLQ